MLLWSPRTWTVFSMAFLSHKLHTQWKTSSACRQSSKLSRRCPTWRRVECQYDNRMTVPSTLRFIALSVTVREHFLHPYIAFSTMSINHGSRYDLSVWCFEDIDGVEFASSRTSLTCILRLDCSTHLLPGPGRLSSSQHHLFSNWTSGKYSEVSILNRTDLNFLRIDSREYVENILADNMRLHLIKKFSTANDRMIFNKDCKSGVASGKKAYRKLVFW